MCIGEHVRALNRVAWGGAPPRTYTLHAVSAPHHHARTSSAMLMAAGAPCCVLFPTMPVSSCVMTSELFCRSYALPSPLLLLYPAHGKWGPLLALGHCARAPTS